MTAAADRQRRLDTDDARQPALKNVHAVVLDSTELRNDLRLAKASAEYLRAYSRHTGARIIVPEVVRREVLAHIEEETAKQIAALRTATRKLESYGVDLSGRGSTGTPLGASRRWIIAAREAFDERLTWLGAEIAPTPTTSHEEVLDRLFDGRKPFRDKRSDRGYRDFLIWKTVLAHRVPYSPEVGRRPVVFVSGNTSDFADDGESAGESLLHPDLLRDQSSCSSHVGC